MAASAASSTQDKDPDSGLESTASVSSLSSSVNEQVQEPELKRRKTIFFDDFTDGIVKFDNGETFKVNRTMLALESNVFHSMFKESAAPDHVIEIENCCPEVFKMFVGCMLNLEECTFDKAVQLLPIACKFQASKFIEKCVKILTPKERDIKICIALNLAISCKCTELEEAIMNYLVHTRCIYFLFSREDFYTSLNLEAMLKLLQKIVVDSFIIRAVFNWGSKYFKSNNLKQFFCDTTINNFISVFSFETIQDLLDFDESDLGAKYFTRTEISKYIKVNGESCNCKRVSWLHFKAGDVLVDTLFVKNVVFLADHVLRVRINTYPMVFYERSRRTYEEIYAVNYKCELLKTKEVVGEYKSSNSNAKMDLRVYCFDLEIDLKKNVVSDLKIEVKRTFYVDCRVLKGSTKTFKIEKNEEELYLTSGVELRHCEKKKK